MEAPIDAEAVNLRKLWFVGGFRSPWLLSCGNVIVRSELLFVCGPTPMRGECAGARGRARAAAARVLLRRVARAACGVGFLSQTAVGPVGTTVAKYKDRAHMVAEAITPPAGGRTAFERPHEPSTARSISKLARPRAVARKPPAASPRRHGDARPRTHPQRRRAPTRAAKHPRMRRGSAASEGRRPDRGAQTTARRLWSMPSVAPRPRHASNRRDRRNGGARRSSSGRRQHAGGDPPKGLQCSYQLRPWRGPRRTC